jgi:ATP-dependent DNA helicase RecQ
VADAMIGQERVDEDEMMFRLLSDPAGADQSGFDDDLFARLAYLCESGQGSDLDLAVLVRHLLRRWSLRDQRDVQVKVAPSISARLRTVADIVDLREVIRDTWWATAWRPAWLDAGTPDSAAAAGTDHGKRFRNSELIADPFFEKHTGYSRYRTPGQRAACRAVVSMPPGSTIIAMLPTSSGKTEVALCLAAQHQYSVTLIVVPTVALAYDFERRFRDHYAKLNPRVDKAALYFAWTADTPAELREVLKSRVREGRQPLLVASPESMTRTLSDLLLDSAGTGRLAGLVIDEAHLVTQWGRDFRPEFRTLADLRRDLIHRAADRGYPLPTTLLLSATLGAYEMNDLHFLFGEPGPCTLIAANALRAEPELWIRADRDIQSRQAHVLEALARLPRPAVLYVSSPDVATDWADRLRHLGYRRLATVTGDTSTEERVRVLEDLRNTPKSPASIDLVVATSAFGLGIDYPHIRTVLHACLPETVDRWYQEVGRGGRDGDVSVGLLVTAPDDRKEAEKLTVTVLLPDTARKRWGDMWRNRQRPASKTFVDLESNRGVGTGSYNRRWNAQVVQGLSELKVCTRVQFDYEDRLELVVDEVRRSDWVAVKSQYGDLDSMDFWEKQWGPWQKVEAGRSKRSLDAITELAEQRITACEAIARYYRPSADTYRLFGRAADLAAPAAPCGRCPGCRRRTITPPDAPPPSPPEVWPVSADLTADLTRLAAATGARNGLILLTTDDYDEVTSPLASALVQRGVRHIAGHVNGAVPDDRWLFCDPEPVGPTDLTPCSTFVVYQPGCQVPGSWLIPSLRTDRRQHVEPPFDVLLVAHGTLINGRRVGPDLAALDARIAMDILRSQS